MQEIQPLASVSLCSIRRADVKDWVIEAVCMRLVVTLKLDCAVNCHPVYLGFR